MGTKNIPGKFDCYANALPDEPMFVLLARDKKAHNIVRSWAHEYRSTKETENSRTGKARLNVEQYAKYCEALDCADAMEAWGGDWRNVERIKQKKRENDTTAGNVASASRNDK
jgi:hypothetical protein